MKVFLNWADPATFPAQHAERYRDQLRYIGSLVTTEGWKDPAGKLPKLTACDAERFKNFAQNARWHNFQEVLSDNGVDITKKDI